MTSDKIETQRTDKLSVSWSKRERDLVYKFERFKSDGGLLNKALTQPVIGDRSLLEELQARGFDLKTLRFSITRTEPK